MVIVVVDRRCQGGYSLASGCFAKVADVDTRPLNWPRTIRKQSYRRAINLYKKDTNYRSRRGSGERQNDAENRRRLPWWREKGVVCDRKWRERSDYDEDLGGVDEIKVRKSPYYKEGAEVWGRKVSVKGNKDIKRKYVSGERFAVCGGGGGGVVGRREGSCVVGCWMLMEGKATGGEGRPECAAGEAMWIIGEKCWDELGHWDTGPLGCAILVYKFSAAGAE